MKQSKKIGIAMVSFDPTAPGGQSELKTRKDYFKDFITRAEEHFAQQNDEFDLKMFLAPEYFLAKREDYNYKNPTGNFTGLFKPRKRTITQQKFDEHQQDIHEHAEKTIAGNYLVIPGTALVTQGVFEFTPDSIPFENVAALLMRSNKRAFYRKRVAYHEWGTESYKSNITQYNTFTEQERAQNRRMEKVRTDFIFINGKDYGLFEVPLGTHDHITVGLEVCADHDGKTLRTHLQSKKVDMHIILSAPVDTQTDAVCARNNGLVVHCSTQLGSRPSLTERDHPGTNVFQATTDTLVWKAGSALEKAKEKSTLKEGELEEESALKKGEVWTFRKKKVTKENHWLPPINSKRQKEHLDQFQKEKCNLGAQETIWRVDLLP